MTISTGRILVATLVFLLAGLLMAASAHGREITDEERTRAGQYLMAPSLVRDARIDVEWFDEGTTFWFRDSRGAHFVDPAKSAMRRLTHEDKTHWTEARSRTEKGRVYASAFDRYVTVEENNLRLFEERSADGKALTSDGEKDVTWQAAPEGWSPEGRFFAALRMDVRAVHHLPIIDYTDAEESFREVPYAKTGGAFGRFELALFDTGSGEKTVVEIGAWEDIYIFPVGWSEDGRELLFLRMTRNAKQLALMAADPATGQSRPVVVEKQETFVGGLDFITGGWRDVYTPLPGTDQFLWLSERDGWRHVYHYNLDGELLGRVTEGAFPVLQVVAVDVDEKQVFFKANGEKRLYDTHLYRAGLDGSGFRRLTDGDGDHEIQMAPSLCCFVDTHSSTQRAPKSELRDRDGALLLTLTEADASQLESIGWTPPEEFVVKADDGETDLYGVIYKPRDFDPDRRYPVIDFIYAGPFTTVVPNTFVTRYPLVARARAFAQLGFITFIVDCRGTVERSKAFQDASYGRIGQIEIPDHVATLRQITAKRPYIDLDRVGIFGASWGGYFALRAMLTAPDVFHVGISGAPGDLTEAPPINEPYMGLPGDNPEGYAAGSNPPLAGNLEGKLLLLHGTADVNAPFSTTMRMVRALIDAGKQHDLAVFPQGDHYFRGSDGPYFAQLMATYFREHLAKK